MIGTSFSAMLRNLLEDYYQHHFSFDEYRAERRALFDRIDREYNGLEAPPQEQKPSEASSAETGVDDKPVEASDAADEVTQQHDSLKTIAFYLNNDSSKRAR